jgi:hypothetical protein
MGRIRAGLSWVFVRGPAAAYAFLDSGSALASFVSVAAIVVSGAVGAGIGALVGVLTQARSVMRPESARWSAAACWWRGCC